MATSVLIGCGSDSRNTADPDAETPLVVLDTVALQEDDSSLVVFPRIRQDPQGGFLVADASEGQLRRYARDGRLIWRFGRRGEGPGEFQEPFVLLRLSDRSLLAVERDERLTRLSPAADSILELLRLPLGGVEDGITLPNGLVLLAGVRDANRTGSRLHLFDPHTDSLGASFFRPFSRAANRQIALTADYTLVDAIGDTVIAAFAPLDTLYVFAPPAFQAMAVPFPPSRFRVAEPITQEAFADPEARGAWLRSFETVTGLYHFSADTVLVVFRTLNPGGVQRNHLMGIRLNGEKVWEASDIPIVYGTLGDTILIQAPWTHEPNVLALTRFK